MGRAAYANECSLEHDNSMPQSFTNHPAVNADKNGGYTVLKVSLKPTECD